MSLVIHFQPPFLTHSITKSCLISRAIIEFVIYNDINFIELHSAIPSIIFNDNYFDRTNNPNVANWWFWQGQSAMGTAEAVKKSLISQLYDYENIGYYTNYVLKDKYISLPEIMIYDPYYYVFNANKKLKKNLSRNSDEIYSYSTSQLESIKVEVDLFSPIFNENELISRLISKNVGVSEENMIKIKLRVCGNNNISNQILSEKEYTVDLGSLSLANTSQNGRLVLSAKVSDEQLNAQYYIWMELLIETDDGYKIFYTLNQEEYFHDEIIKVESDYDSGRRKKNQMICSNFPVAWNGYVTYTGAHCLMNADFITKLPQGDVLFAHYRPDTITKDTVKQFLGRIVIYAPNDEVVTFKDIDLNTKIVLYDTESKKTKILNGISDLQSEIEELKDQTLFAFIAITKGMTLSYDQNEYLTSLFNMTIDLKNDSNCFWGYTGQVYLDDKDNKKIKKYQENIIRFGEGPIAMTFEDKSAPFISMISPELNYVTNGFGDVTDKLYVEFNTDDPNRIDSINVSIRRCPDMMLPGIFSNYSHEEPFVATSLIERPNSTSHITSFNYTFTDLREDFVSEGRYFVNIVVKDGTIIPNIATYKHNFYIDRTPPLINISNIDDTIRVSQRKKEQFAYISYVTDNLSGVFFEPETIKFIYDRKIGENYDNFDTIFPEYFTYGYTMNQLPLNSDWDDGIYRLRLTAMDKAFNASSDIVKYMEFDKTPPNIVFIDSLPDVVLFNSLSENIVYSYTTNEITRGELIFDKTDDVLTHTIIDSSTSYDESYVRGQTATCSKTISKDNLFVLPDGVYSLDMKYMDDLENDTIIRTKSIILDRTAPLAKQLLVNNFITTNGEIVSINFIVSEANDDDNNIGKVTYKVMKDATEISNGNVTLSSANKEREVTIQYQIKDNENGREQVEVVLTDENNNSSTFYANYIVNTLGAFISSPTNNSSINYGNLAVFGIASDPDITNNYNFKDYRLYYSVDGVRSNRYIMVPDDCVGDSLNISIKPVNADNLLGYIDFISIADENPTFDNFAIILITSELNTETQIRDSINIILDRGVAVVNPSITFETNESSLTSTTFGYSVNNQSSEMLLSVYNGSNELVNRLSLNNYYVVNEKYPMTNPSGIYVYSYNGSNFIECGESVSETEIIIKNISIVNNSGVKIADDTIYTFNAGDILEFSYNPSLPFTLRTNEYNNIYLTETLKSQDKEMEFMGEREIEWKYLDLMGKSINPGPYRVVLEAIGLGQGYDQKEIVIDKESNLQFQEFSVNPPIVNPYEAGSETSIIGIKFNEDAYYDLILTLPDGSATINLCENAFIRGNEFENYEFNGYYLNQLQIGDWRITLQARNILGTSIDSKIKNIKVQSNDIATYYNGLNIPNEYVGNILNDTTYVNAQPLYKCDYLPTGTLKGAIPYNFTICAHAKRQLDGVKFTYTEKILETPKLSPIFLKVLNTYSSTLTTDPDSGSVVVSKSLESTIKMHYRINVEKQSTFNYDGPSYTYSVYYTKGSSSTQFGRIDRTITCSSSAIEDSILINENNYSDSITMYAVVKINSNANVNMYIAPTFSEIDTSILNPVEIIDSLLTFVLQDNNTFPTYMSIQSLTRLELFNKIITIHKDSANVNTDIVSIGTEHQPCFCNYYHNIAVTGYRSEGNHVYQNQVSSGTSATFSVDSMYLKYYNYSPIKLKKISGSYYLICNPESYNTQYTNYIINDSLCINDAGVYSTNTYNFADENVIAFNKKHDYYQDSIIIDRIEFDHSQPIKLTSLTFPCNRNQTLSVSTNISGRDWSYIEDYNYNSANLKLLSIYDDLSAKEFPSQGITNKKYFKELYQFIEKNISYKLQQKHLYYNNLANLNDKIVLNLVDDEHSLAKFNNIVFQTNGGIDSILYNEFDNTKTVSEPKLNIYFKEIHGAFYIACFEYQPNTTIYTKKINQLLSNRNISLTTHSRLAIALSDYSEQASSDSIALTENNYPSNTTYVLCRMDLPTEVGNYFLEFKEVDDNDDSLIISNNSNATISGEIEWKEYVVKSYIPNFDNFISVDSDYDSFIVEQEITRNDSIQVYSEFNISMQSKYLLPQDITQIKYNYNSNFSSIPKLIEVEYTTPQDTATRVLRPQILPISINVDLSDYQREWSKVALLTSGTADSIIIPFTELGYPEKLFFEVDDGEIMRDSSEIIVINKVYKDYIIKDGCCNGGYKFKITKTNSKGNIFYNINNVTQSNPDLIVDKWNTNIFYPDGNQNEDLIAKDTAMQVLGENALDYFQAKLQLRAKEKGFIPISLDVNGIYTTDDISNKYYKLYYRNEDGLIPFMDTYTKLESLDMTVGYLEAAQLYGDCKLICKVYEQSTEDVDDPLGFDYVGVTYTPVSIFAKDIKIGDLIYYYSDRMLNATDERIQNNLATFSPYYRTQAYFNKSYMELYGEPILAKVVTVYPNDALVDNGNTPYLGGYKCPIMTLYPKGINYPAGEHPLIKYNLTGEELTEIGITSTDLRNGVFKIYQENNSGDLRELLTAYNINDYGDIEFYIDWANIPDDEEVDGLYYTMLKTNETDPVKPEEIQIVSKSKDGIRIKGRKNGATEIGFMITDPMQSIYNALYWYDKKVALEQKKKEGGWNLFDAVLTDEPDTLDDSLLVNVFTGQVTNGEFDILIPSDSLFEGHNRIFIGNPDAFRYAKQKMRYYEFEPDQDTTTTTKNTAVEALDLQYTKVPPEIVLDENYNLPAYITNINSADSIKFTTTRPALVVLFLYDLTGREIVSKAYNVDTEMELFAWDGWINGVPAPKGEYQLMMIAYDSEGYISDEVSGTFKVERGIQFEITSPVKEKWLKGTQQMRVAIADGQNCYVDWTLTRETDTLETIKGMLSYGYENLYTYNYNDGWYWLNAYAYNKYGDKGEDVIQVLIDNDPPFIEMINSQGLYVGADTVFYRLEKTVRFVVSDINSAIKIVCYNYSNIEQIINTDSVTLYSFSLQLSDINGYNLELIAIDRCGNVTDSYSYNFVKDIKSPALHLTVGEPKKISDNKTYIADYTPIWINAEDYLSGVKSIWYTTETPTDGTIWNEYDMNFIYLDYTGNDADTLYYKAEDNVGNITNRSSIFYFDMTPPVSEITYTEPSYINEDGIYLTDNSTLIITSTDDMTGVRQVVWTMDGVETKTADSIITVALNDLTDGGHTVTYYAEDNANNVEEVKTFVFIIDNTPPSIAINYNMPQYRGVDYQFVTAEASIDVTAVDLGCGVKESSYDIDGIRTGEFTETANILLIGLAENIYRISIQTEDNIGNENSKNEEFVIDNSSPTTVMNIGEPKYQKIDTMLVTSATLITLTSTDNPTTTPYSGVREIHYGYATENIIGSAVVTDNILGSDGAYLYKYFAIDNLMNTENEKTELFELDNTAPQVRITYPYSGIFVNQPVNVMGFAEDKNFYRWKLEYRNKESAEWVEITGWQEGTPCAGSRGPEAGETSAMSLAPCAVSESKTKSGLVGWYAGGEKEAGSLAPWAKESSELRVNSLELEEEKMLGVFRADELANGEYVIRLTAQDLVYNTGISEIEVKVGEPVRDLELTGYLKPEGVWAGDYIYIADSQHKRIVKTNEENELLMEIREFQPSDVFVDNSGTIYATDQDSRVYAYNTDGTELFNIDGHLHPKGIEVRNGLIYVADTYRNRIVIYNMSGEVQREISNVKHPEGIAVDEAGNIFTCINESNEIRGYNKDGEEIFRYGVVGHDAGEFVRAVDIDVDSKGYLWVADRNNNRVHMIDWVRGYDLLLIGSIGHRNKPTDGMNKPEGLSIVEENGIPRYVYIADTNNDRIIRYDLNEVYTDQKARMMAGEGDALEIGQFLPFPNPTSSVSNIRIVLNKAADLTFNIYTVTGKLVYREETAGTDGINQIVWNGMNAEGKEVLNGVYNIQVVAETTTGEKAEKWSKVAIIK